jgi:hypothetical protein
LERPAGNKPGTFILDAAYAQFIMQQAMYHFGTLKTLLMTNVKEKGRKLCVLCRCSGFFAIAYDH